MHIGIARVNLLNTLTAGSLTRNEKLVFSPKRTQSSVSMSNMTFDICWRTNFTLMLPLTAC